MPRCKQKARTAAKKVTRYLCTISGENPPAFMQSSNYCTYFWSRVWEPKLCEYYRAGYCSYIPAQRAAARKGRAHQ